MDFSNVSNVLDNIINILPGSPFSAYIDALDKLPYLNTLNYFIPVGQIIAVGESWLVSIVIFYAVMVLMRWIKVIN